MVTLNPTTIQGIVILEHINKAIDGIVGLEEIPQDEREELVHDGKEFYDRIARLLTLNPDLHDRIQGISFEAFYRDHMKRGDKGRLAERLGITTHQFTNIIRGVQRASLQMEQRIQYAVHELYGVRVYFPDDTPSQKKSQPAELDADEESQADSA